MRTYYRVVKNKYGKTFIHTRIKRLADAISFCTEVDYHVFDNADGSKTYSFLFSEHLEQMVKQLIQFHEESLQIKEDK